MCWFYAGVAPVSGSAFHLNNHNEMGFLCAVDMLILMSLGKISVFTVSHYGKEITID